MRGSGKFFGSAAVLFALWLALSGHVSGLFAGLGAISALLAGWAGIRMRRAARLDGAFRPGTALLSYFFWLIREITRANIDVARIILSPSLPVSPGMIEVTARQTTDLGRTLFANSITLTPGTVTVETGPAKMGPVETGPESAARQGKVFLVHALTRDAGCRRGLEEMGHRICALEGKN